MDYFSSDLHLYHSNVIKYCNRPFSNADEMNEYIIKKHNSVVTDEDTWHCVGDFAFCGAGKHSHILSRLNGKKKIIYMGNHDYRWKKPAKLVSLGWDEAYFDPVDWEHSGVKFRISHYPFEGYDHKGLEDRYKELRPSRENIDWLIMGHVHSDWQIMENQFNVGVDNFDYTPQSIDSILAKIKDINPKTSLDNLKKA